MWERSLSFERNGKCAAAVGWTPCAAVLDNFFGPFPSIFLAAQPHPFPPGLGLCLASSAPKAAVEGRCMLLPRKRRPPSAILQVSVESVVLRSSVAAVVFDLCVSFTPSTSCYF
jgi:hypothetical protein